MTYTFKVQGFAKNFVVDAVDTDPDKWEVVKQLKYMPDKNSFILNKFNKDYPHLKVTKADEIYKLASRSVKLNEWLASSNMEYAGSTQVPEYFKNHVNQKDFFSAQEKIEKLNIVAKNHANKLMALATEYKEKVDEVNKQHDIEVDKILQKDKILHVMTLDSTKLPLSIQLAIENFTPTATVTRRTFAREMLVNYKVALLKAINDDKTLDIIDLIDKLQEK